MKKRNILTFLQIFIIFVLIIDAYNIYFLYITQNQDIIFYSSICIFIVLLFLIHPKVMKKVIRWLDIDIYSIIQPSFVIQGCLICLGLLIAIYTLVYPKIEEIVNDNAQKVIKLIDRTQKLEDKLKNAKLNEKKEIMDKINENVDEIATINQDPSGVFKDFIIVMAFFSIPLISYSIQILGITDIIDFRLKIFIEALPVPIFFLGIIFLVILFLYVITKLNNMATRDFDKTVEKIRKDLENQR